MNFFIYIIINLLIFLFIFSPSLILIFFFNISFWDSNNLLIHLIITLFNIIFVSFSLESPSFREFIFHSRIYQFLTRKYPNVNQYENISECLRKYRNDITYKNIEMIPKSILNDKIFLIGAIKMKPSFYNFIDKKMIDFDIVKTYVDNYQSSINFNCIPNKYKNFKEIVLKLSNISQNYHHLNEDLQMDDDIIIKALREKGPKNSWVKSEYSNVKIINDDFNYDRRYGYFNLPKEFQDNIYFIKKALEINGNILKFLNHKNDKEFVKIAINENPKICEFLSDTLKNDKEIALFAIEKDISVINFFDDSIKDYEILSIMMEKNEDFIKYNKIPYEGFEESWKKLLIKNGNNIKYLDQKWSKGKTYIEKTEINNFFE